MVSLNVHPQDSSIASVLGSLNGFVVAKNNVGQVYWPSYGINTIGSIHVAAGYKLYNTGAVDTAKISGCDSECRHFSH